MTSRDYIEREPRYEVIDFGTESATDPEAAALRIVLERLRQDLYAMQRAMARVMDERDSWRNAYHRLLGESNGTHG